ncbi:MAG TPA: major capsid protein [Planctomycetota bacterium]|nr:major capsid protein [Planctomycetota bacterium]
MALFRDISGHQRLTQEFIPEPCFADVYRYDREDFELSLAPITGRTSTSKEVKTQDKAVKYISLLHVRVHKKLYSADLFTQRAPGELSDNAAALVMKTRESLRNRVKLTIERLCSMAMRGQIVITKAAFPDTEVEGAGYSNPVTALTPPQTSWASEAAKILSKDVQSWRVQMQRACGVPIDRLLFNGSSVTGYLLKNTEVIDWIGKTQRGVQVFDTAVLGRAGGIPNWEDYNGFYKPEGGLATPFVADNEVFSLPSGGLASLRLIQGFGEIPAQAFGVGPEAAGIAGSIKAAEPGIFEYISPIQDGDPPGIKVFCGWYGVPLVKLPQAIGYRADVTSTQA